MPGKIAAAWPGMGPDGCGRTLRPARPSREIAKPISIGSDVWVGGDAIILPGVVIGSWSVIGAGSVVTRDVPDDVFAAGNPCRVIRAIAE